MNATLNIPIKALVVDDVPSARKITVRFLSKVGVTDITEAEGVADALQKIQDNDFNLLICDVHLKDGKGPEVLQKLSDSPKRSQLKSIFITSDMDKSTFLEAIEQGVTTYLLKPFSPDSLLSTINQLFK